MVDELIAEGELLEVWLQPNQWGLPPHLLLLPTFAGPLLREPTRARGTAAALAASPIAGIAALAGSP